MFLSEALNSKIQLYDPRVIRDVRRDTSGWSKFHPATKAIGDTIAVPASIIANIQSNVWKPLVLLRLAYLPRVGGEEMVRVMVGDQAWDHPFSFFEAVRGHGLRTDATGEIF